MKKSEGSRVLRRIRFAFVGWLALSPSAHAVDLTWNGFASVFGRDNFTDISSNTALPHELDFSRNTRLGLNLRSDFSEQWAAVAQMVASGDRLAQAGINPDWTPHFDWLFLSYTPIHGLNIKAGRQLFPNWLVAEYIDVGYNYPWRQPPQQVYEISPFKSFEGVSMSYQYHLGDQNLTARVFGGDARDSFHADATGSISVKYLLGGALNLDGDGWHIQGTFSRFNLEFGQDTGIIAGVNQGPGVVFSQPVLVDLFADGVQILTLGARYDRGGLLAYTEFGQAWSNSGTPIQGSYFGHWAQGYYGTLGYHLGAWLPHYTLGYGKFDLGFISGTQYSQILGLNFQIDPSVVIKAEYMWERSVNGALLLTAPGTSQSVALGLDVVF